MKISVFFFAIVSIGILFISYLSIIYFVDPYEKKDLTKDQIRISIKISPSIIIYNHTKNVDLSIEIFNNVSTPIFIDKTILDGDGINTFIQHGNQLICSFGIEIDCYPPEYIKLKRNEKIHLNWNLIGLLYNNYTSDNWTKVDFPKNGQCNVYVQYSVDSGLIATSNTILIRIQ